MDHLKLPAELSCMALGAAHLTEDYYQQHQSRTKGEDAVFLLVKVFTLDFLIRTHLSSLLEELLSSLSLRTAVVLFKGTGSFPSVWLPGSSAEAHICWHWSFTLLGKSFWFPPLIFGLLSADP